MLALKSGPQIAANVGNPAGLLCRRIWYSVGKSGVLGITEYRQGRPLCIIACIVGTKFGWGTIILWGTNRINRVVSSESNHTVTYTPPECHTHTLGHIQCSPSIRHVFGRRIVLARPQRSLYITRTFCRQHCS